MSTEESVKGTANKKRQFIAAVVLLCLLVLIAVAKFAFGLPREVVAIALNLSMIGFFLFFAIDLLLQKRHVGAVVCFLCAVLFLAMSFL